MFVLDSLLISGVSWVLGAVRAAAEAERDDPDRLREQLLEAELRRESGELDDAAFAAVEADLLDRMRLARAREGRGGPLGLSRAEPIGASPGERVTAEAAISGHFHDETVASRPAAHGSATGEPAGGGGQAVSRRAGDRLQRPPQPRRTSGGAAGARRTSRGVSGSARTRRAPGRQPRS